MSDDRFAIERQSDNSLILRLVGDWTLAQGVPDAIEVENILSNMSPDTALSVDASKLHSWDSALVRFLMALREATEARNVDLDLGSLPEGARRLVFLALAVPERADARRVEKRDSFLTAVGATAIEASASCYRASAFLGEVVLMFARFLTGRAAFRRSDLWLTMQQCGAESLPIVTVISLLIGLILAFVGAVQLQQFGAGIYVADLVGIAMTREMGAIMTGIVLAGRVGAAFAANIGTMQGNEEIDALRTLGLSPMDFLVLPRMLSLMLMMPLLTIYADVVGMFGGWIVGVGMLDLTSAAYLTATQGGVGITDVALGVFKGAVFGAVVALAGCQRGMECGRSSAAVGSATTSAVVTGIVLIIVIDAVFAVLTHILGI